MEAYLPNNIEAEQALLGNLINNPDVILQISHLPTASDFFLEKHKLIFATIYTLADTGKAVDLIIIKEALQNKKQLEKSGGAVYLSELTSKGVLSSDVDFYASIIIEKSQRRSLIKNAHHMLESAKDESMEVQNLLENNEKEIFAITNKTQESAYFPFRHFYDEFSHLINKDRKPGEYSGIPTGFPRLDSMLTGLQLGELIIIGARPSVGKTALALNMVNNIAIDNDIPAGFFSLEMTGRDIISRIVCMRSGITGNKIRQNVLSTEDIKQIARSSVVATDAPLYISDMTSMSLFDIKIQSRRLINRENVKIIFIDYLGLIQFQKDNVGGHYRPMPKFEQFSEISRSLKALARELNVPIVVLSQLNRDAENSEPSLANIRESGAIEQDADVVLFLHRKSREDNETNLIIAKQRNGPVGKVNFIFNPGHMKFTEETNTQNRAF